MIKLVAKMGNGYAGCDHRRSSAATKTLFLGGQNLFLGGPKFLGWSTFLYLSQNWSTFLRVLC